MEEVEVFRKVMILSLGKRRNRWDSRLLKHCKCNNIFLNSNRKTIFLDMQVP